MDHTLLAVLALIAFALIFDYINGFHDAANSIATVVSTRVLSPGKAVVWAALAMRIGGGHLDPRYWRCWSRTQYNRVLRKLGANGRYILEREDMLELKCFHAGGEAKWWLPEAYEAGILDQKNDVLENGAVAPFVEITPREFHVLQRNRQWLRRLGYYSVFK